MVDTSTSAAVTTIRKYSDIDAILSKVHSPPYSWAHKEKAEIIQIGNSSWPQSDCNHPSISSGSFYSVSQDYPVLR